MTDQLRMTLYPRCPLRHPTLGKQCDASLGHGGQHYFRNPATDEPRYFTPTPTDEDIAELGEQLLDVVVVRHHDRVSGETFIECLICKHWEEHAPWCPIPILQEWMERP